MTQDRTIKTLLFLCATILVLGALYLARSIIAPVTFSLFIVAIVWPIQRTLQKRIPKLLALANDDGKGSGAANSLWPKAAHAARIGVFE